MLMFQAIGDEDIDAEVCWLIMFKKDLGQVADHLQEPLDIDCCEIDPDILRLAHEQRDQPKDEVTSVSESYSRPA
jgi:hypothetical protein